MMKTTLFGVATVAAAAIIAVAAPGQAQGQRITAKNNAALRISPTSNAHILATVPRGSTLTLDHCNANQWCRVQYRNQTGWMALVNLNMPAHHGGVATLRQDAALRAGAGTEFTVVGTLRAGSSADVIECQPSWCHVRQGTRSGWVSRSLIDLGSGVGIPQPPVPPYQGTATLRQDAALRAGAGSQFTIVGTLRAGSRADVAECQPSWCHVRQGARSGWVSRSLIDLGGGVGIPQPPVPPYQGSATLRQDAALRAGAGSEFTIVGTLRGGSHADVSECQPSWCRVKQGTRSGWVSRSLLNLSGGIAPTVCTTEYAPVCARAGQQNKTFSNACQANAAGWSIQYQGQCR